jgi:hypothetical protein
MPGRAIETTTIIIGIIIIGIIITGMITIITTRT